MSETYPFDPFEDDVQQAQTANVAALDDDPETASRSIELAKASGVPASAIYGDVDGFERQHRAALGAHIVGNNLHIADYLNSDPLAAKLSHDDLGQLDTASQAISAIPHKSNLQRAVDAFKEGFGEFSDQAFFTEPFLHPPGDLRRPADIEWMIRNPAVASVMMGVGGLVGAPFTLMGKAFGGALSVANEFGGREFAGLLEYGMMRGDIRSGSTYNTNLTRQLYRDLKNVKPEPQAPSGRIIIDTPAEIVGGPEISQAISAATPWVRAGRDAPVGVDPLLDHAKIDQAKRDGDFLADALSESAKSTTRERSPEYYTNFVRSHVGNREIGISADAVRELYGDKQPAPGDNLLGWIPDIGDRLAAAEATGGDVKVPLADWLGHVDPEVGKALHDHLRARVDGLTIDEGKMLESREKPTEHTLPDPNQELMDRAKPLNPDNVIVPLDASKAQALLKPMDRTITPEKLAGAQEFLGSRPESWNPSEFNIRKDTRGEDRVEIIDGVHRWQAAQDRGMKAIPTEMSKEAAAEAKRLGLVAEPPKRTEASVINEPLPLLRAHSGLEPMFSVGDRKIKLERKGTPEQNYTGDVAFHDFDLIDENNNPVGSINLSEQKGGKQIYVEMIQAGTKEKKYYDPNFLGPALIRDIARQLKAEFPKAFGPDGEGITGHRVSGAREKAGSWEAPSAMPKVKFNQELSPEQVQAFRDLLSPHWVDEGQGTEALYKPTALWSKNERALEAAIKEEVTRIAPGVEVKMASTIHNEGATGTVYGVFKGDAELGLPEMILSMEHSDPAGIARHEVIHHLKQMGLFTQNEWFTLTRAARSEGWVERYQIDKRYPELDNAGKLEEAVAEGYRDWKAGKLKLKDPSAFQKIADFFERIRLRVKEILGRDFTWDELFQRVDEGEVGRREDVNSRRGEAMQPALEPKFSQDEGRPDIGGEEAKSLREQIAKLKGGLELDRGHGKDLTSDPRRNELKQLRSKLRDITSGMVGLPVDLYDRYMKLIKEKNDADLAAATRSAERQQAKTQTKEWKANRTDMRDQVREEIESRPDIAVDQLMAEEKLKFHPDFLTPEQKAALPKEYIQKKNGINPDDAAGFFGYHSGDAMVDRLALLTHDRQAAGMKAKEWTNHLIDAETDRRMEEKYGNLAENILDEAKDQATSETQLNLIHEETFLLGMMAGEKFPLTKGELRAQLREIFDKTPISSISSDEYLRASGKASRAAEQFRMEKDFEAAFREKQRQNNAVILASYARAYEKARKSFDRQAKTLGKKEVPSIAPEWLNWIHDILDRTGNRVRRGREHIEENIFRQGETTLRDFIETQESDSYAQKEIPVAEFLLDPNFTSTMDDLTAKQFYDLKQSVDVLAKQGRDERKIYIKGEAADLAETLKEIRGKIQTFPVQLLPEEGGKFEHPKTFMAGLVAIPTLLHRWDRADPRGIINRYINYPLRRAANTEDGLIRETARGLKEVGELVDPEKLVDSPFPDPRTRTEANPEGEAWKNFKRKHVLGMLAHAGNPSNWRVLAKGYSADPVALMKWLVDNTTKEDWAQAQKRGDTIFKNLIAKADVVKEHTTGFTVEKIPLEPFTNPHGNFDGWYHPLDADPIRKEVWVKQENGTYTRNPTGPRDKLFDKFGKTYATTADGYTRKRTGAIYPVDLDITAMNGTIMQMIHDISYSQTLVEVQKVLGNKAFQADVSRHYGEHYRGLLDKYLQDMAGQQSNPGKIWKWADSWSNYLRQNMIGTYIGFNVYTALKHGPTAAVWSAREVGMPFIKASAKTIPEMILGDPIRKAAEIVGADWISSAVRSMYAKSPDLALTMSEFAMEHGESLQRREKNWQDTIAGETKVIKGESTKREKVLQAGSWLVAKSDMLSAKATWIGEYNKRTAEGLSHGEAVDLADNAVDRAHGSTARTNQPELVRGGGPAHSWFVTVYGFMGNRLQRMIETGHKLNDAYQLGKEGELKAAAKMAPTILADFMTYAMYPILVEEIVSGMNTDDRRTGLQHLGSAMLLGAGSSFLYLRDLAHGLASSHEPGAGMLSSFGHDIASVFRDVRKDAFSKQRAGKTVQDMLTLLGDIKGISPKPIANAARFGIDLVNKQVRPKSGADYFYGVTKGTTEKRKVK